MKGHNLRVFLTPRHYCIAAETSCELNINVETISKSTKDSIGDFEEIDVVGKKWTIKGESLFFPNLVNSGDQVAVDTATIFGNIKYFIGDEWPISLKAGEVISAKIESNHHDDTEAFIINGNTFHSSPYHAEEDCVVYLGCLEEVTMSFIVLKEDPTAFSVKQFIDTLHGELKIDIALALTNSTDNNREIKETLVSGRAYLTELTINSKNKEHVTASFTATGIGELH